MGAAPEKAGLLLLVSVPRLGVVSVTAGAIVSIVKVLGALAPMLPSLLDCVAWAV